MPTPAGHTASRGRLCTPHVCWSKVSVLRVPRRLWELGHPCVSPVVPGKIPALSPWYGKDQGWSVAQLGHSTLPPPTCSLPLKTPSINKQRRKWSPNPRHINDIGAASSLVAQRAGLGSGWDPRQHQYVPPPLCIAVGDVWVGVLLTPGLM